MGKAERRATFVYTFATTTLTTHARRGIVLTGAIAHGQLAVSTICYKGNQNHVFCPSYEKPRRLARVTCSRKHHIRIRLATPRFASAPPLPTNRFTNTRRSSFTGTVRVFAGTTVTTRFLRYVSRVVLTAPHATRYTFSAVHHGVSI